MENNPIRLAELKIVQGQSGKGLQLVCSCGCINWNHLEMPESVWKCRNCGRVLTSYYPGLVQAFLAFEKEHAADGQTLPQ